jgi:hypothetical protein
MKKNWNQLIIHTKKIHYLKFFKIKNLLNNFLKFQMSFTTCKWGVMNMTFEKKL